MNERETIERFVDNAERFCSLVEHHQPLTAKEFARSCAACLADLYGAAVTLSLLSVEIDSEELIEDAVSTDQAKAIDDQIGQKLGGDCLYWTVLDARVESGRVEGEGVGDLGDELADIYRDLKNGLIAFNRSLANEAIWHWQWGFRSHWGEHVVSALPSCTELFMPALRKSSSPFPQKAD